MAALERNLCDRPVRKQHVEAFFGCLFYRRLPFVPISTVICLFYALLRVGFKSVAQISRPECIKTMTSCECRMWGISPWLNFFSKSHISNHFHNNYKHETSELFSLNRSIVGHWLIAIRCTDFLS